MVLGNGALAPKFELPIVGEDRLANLESALIRGPAVVAIYKSSCRASKTALPFLQRLYQSYPQDRLTVWGLSLDSPNVTSSFMRRYEITFPNLVDEEGYPTAQAYGVTDTPSIFLISSLGHVIWQAVGFAKTDMDVLSREVAQLIQVPAVNITSDSDEVPDSVPG